MSVTLQTLATNSSAVLESLTKTDTDARELRFGIDKKGTLVIFKGREFLLHPKQCQRAMAFLKKNEFCATTKASFNPGNLRLRSKPACDLLSKLFKHDDAQRDQRSPLDLFSSHFPAGQPGSSETLQQMETTPPHSPRARERVVDARGYTKSTADFLDAFNKETGMSYGVPRANASESLSSSANVDGNRLTGEYDPVPPCLAR